MSTDAIALVIGPGPVTLGQGACFQYTAARACRRLRRLGMRVLVLEDNPATLMDLGGGEDDLFIEPPAPEVVGRIVEQSGAGYIWYSLGGKRGWLLALRLAGEGWYEKLGLTTPGLEDRAMWLCGDRSLLRENLESRGIANPAFRAVANIREAQDAAESLGFPLVVRPHFSCGGWGAGLAYNLEEYPLLLEEAMRESITGEVLVEEALIGWRKYLALVMRDGQGDVGLAGILEQVEPMPKHDQDAVLVYPSPSLGREEAYALGEMAREVAESLDLLGLAEIKLAAGPGWEALHVIDVNPWPWRVTPLLETALGVNLLHVHLDLVMGKVLPRAYLETGDRPAPAAMVAVPRPGFRVEGDGEGYRALGCRSVGRNIFRGGDVAEAAAGALRVLSRTGNQDPEGGVVEILSVLNRGVGKYLSGQAGGETLPVEGGVVPICVSRGTEGDLGDGVLLLAGEERDPGGGYEADVNCFQALKAWKEEGGKAVLYTPDPCLALLAAEDADAVFLGPLVPACVSGTVYSTGVGGLVAHFGGSSAWHCAGELARSGLEVWGWEEPDAQWGARRLLERLRPAGLEVVDFSLSRGYEEGSGVLSKGVFPVLATVEGRWGERAQRLIYSREDGEEFLREFPGEEVLWREVREEAQEIQVEAVAGVSGGHLVLLWEQLDEAGICSADGLAVYPPFYLTSEQSARVLALVNNAIEVLGWRGNLSMKIFLNDGDIYLWDLCRGPSANLPFLHRASSLPLASYGMLSLSGREPEVQAGIDYCSAVRAPLIPFGVIAGSDILPSPQRRSTGAVMGVASDPGTALAKAMWSEGLKPQLGGRAFLSVANREKRRAVLLARELQAAGYVLMATRGTAHALAAAGIEVETANKLREGRPNILDYIRNGLVGMVINIPRGKHPHSDGFYIRAASARHGIPCITNMEVALALARGLREADPQAWEVRPLMEYGRHRHEVRGG